MGSLPRALNCIKDKALACIEKKKLLKKLPLKQKDLVHRIALCLRQAGYECFMIGGAVRDLLLDRPIKDIDFTSNAKPLDVQKLFTKTIPTGLQHGTIMVRMGGESFEITSYRQDGSYEDARRPKEIQYASSLSQDLERRDFTINALAYDPLEGRLIDEHGGLQDLQQKSIRTIGSPQERFYEDALRPVRACRFACALGFVLEEKTKQALALPIVHQRAKKVAIERFSEELWKGFRAREVSRMIKLLEESGLTKVFLSAEQAAQATKQECLDKLDSLYPASSVLRMAYWRYALGLGTERNVQAWGQALRLGGKITKELMFFCHYFRLQLEELKKLNENKDAQNYALRCFLSEMKKRYRPSMAKLLEESALFVPYCIAPKEVLQIYQESPLTLADLAIDGALLKKEGLLGKAIGDTLKACLELVLKRPDCNQKESLREYAEKYAGKHSKKT